MQTEDRPTGVERSLRRDYRPLTNELKRVVHSCQLLAENSLFLASLHAQGFLSRHRPGVCSPRVWFTPDRPTVTYAIWPIYQLLGITVVDEPDDADLIYWFDGSDAAEVRPVDEHVLRHCRNKPSVNVACTDITKRRVGRVFRDVFGYDLDVDPTSHHGPLVRKSNANACHDGHVLDGPLTSTDEQLVYQRFIESRKSDGEVEALRVPIVGHSIPFVYRQTRTAQQRFGPPMTSTLCHTSDTLAPFEIDRILTLCDQMGLDCGELDVLRDNTDHNIYVVDVNRTAAGPPRRPLRDRYRATILCARAFRQSFLTGDTLERTKSAQRRRSRPSASP